MKRIIAILLVMLALTSAVAFSEGVYDDRLTIVAMIGDASPFVYTVETALFEKGWLTEEEIDGVFDEYTELAVMNFQAYRGFEPDGMLTKIQFYWLHRTYYNEWFDKSNVVYITENGRRYHAWDCVNIQNSYNVMPISVNIALYNNYLPCRVCNPW